MNSSRLLVIITMIVMISSLIELYFFIALPLHVVANNSFKEGVNHWNSKLVKGDDLVDLLVNSTSEKVVSESYSCALTLLGRNNTSLAGSSVWAVLYQELPEYPLTKSSTLRFAMMLGENDFERVLSYSDAAAVYLSLMVTNETNEFFLTYAWVLRETDSVKITKETFQEATSLEILYLESINSSSMENLTVVYETPIFQQSGRENNILTPGDWKIRGDIEAGILLWNFRSPSFSWTFTLYIGYIDIVYYWPLNSIFVREY